MLSDSLHISTSKQNIEDQSQKVLVYLICGNPGLIEYYRDFFNQLATSLKASSGNIQYDLRGQSLAGFELDGQNDQWPKRPPYTLKKQISHVRTQIDTAASEVCNNIERHSDSSPSGKLPVILIGHSVGAYILLEILSQRQNSQGSRGSNESNVDYEIVGGICLFPTVVDIAKSPSGRIAAVSLTYSSVSAQILTNDQPATDIHPWLRNLNTLPR